MMLFPFYQDVIEEINNAPKSDTVSNLQELEEHVKTLDESGFKLAIHHINAAIIPQNPKFSFSNEKLRQSFLKKWEDLSR